MRALLALTAIFCFLVGGGVGYLLSQYRFPRAAAYAPTESLRIKSGTEVGLLPRGTLMHYRTRDRDHVTFYAFVRVPVDQATLLIKPVVVERGGDSRYLESQP